MASRRITVVASEVLGAGGVGGAGTADSLLAVALGRAGHEVELLFARAEHVGTINAEWERIYAESGVRVRQLVGRARVDPPYFTPTVDVLHALSEDRPEVVIANDWRGLVLAPLRSREAGRALRETAFVILCHGPSTVLVEFSQKVPDTLERFAMDVAERTAVGLADQVVSPSAWLLDWMRGRRWPVPASAQVVQYLSQATALGERPPRAGYGGPVRRLAFFGQMREGKGVRILLSALNAIEPDLLEGKELLFLGRVTRRWTPESVTDALAPHVRERVTGIRFETALDRSEALAELRVAGTLAVMPSLLDNSPNTVSECIEQAIPFVASTAGGIPELVAEEDRARVLVDPREDLLREALRRALSDPDGFAPARPAREPREALDAWLALVGSITPRARPALGAGGGRVSVVAVGKEAVPVAERVAEDARGHADVEVIPAPSRRVGLAAATGEWVLFLDESLVADDQALARLLEARDASGAEVVTCGVRVGDHRSSMRLALGDPGALGLIENHYGALALIRRARLDEVVFPLDELKPDPMWPILAQLVLSGARVAAVPEPLGATRGGHGTIRDVPGYGLAVLGAFERAPAGALPDMPLLAATLGSAVLTERTVERRGEVGITGARRTLGVLRREGVRGVVRRVRNRVDTR